jgi:hypothetical protein
VGTLGELLEKLALSQYKQLFTEQEVDLATFLMLSEADLRELGVQTFGARRKMVLGETCECFEYRLRWKLISIY